MKANLAPVLKNILFVFLLCYLQVLITGCSTNPQADNETAIVLKNVTVIDAVNGVREGQSVVVKGNRIIDAGRTGEINEPAGAKIIDYSGKFMLPGLWDAHMHLTNNDILNPVIYQLYLINGITYIRDTSAEFDLLQPLLDSAAKLHGIAPRVFITGPHIDGSPVSWSSSVSATSVEQGENLLDSIINAGVDQIKIYELISPEVYSAVLSRATEKGYKVSGHVPLTMDAVEAVNAGLASIEHLNNVELAMSSDWDSLLNARQQIINEGAGKTGNQIRNQIYQAQRLHAFNTQDENRREEVLKAMAENNTWQVPTLVILSAVENGMYAREDFRNSFNYLPEPLKTDWRNYAVKVSEQPISEVDKAHAHWANDIVSRLPAAGIGVMAGTDAPLFALTPGFSLHQELALLVNAGLTPMQAIEAATLKPAQFFGLEDEQGSIAKGMMADLVILDDNPLEDIRNTQSIQAVMRDGHLHTRTDLDKIEAELKKSAESLKME